MIELIGTADHPKSISREHASNEARVVGALRTLDDADFAIAADQIETLAREK